MVIHVGAPKTGSTYIQKRLRSAGTAVRKYGVCYPIDPMIEKTDANAKLLAYTLQGKAPSRFLRSYPNINITALSAAEALQRLLKQWRADQETLVLSAETLNPADAHSLRNLLPKQYNPTIVLFVRRQDTWIESYFNQLVKTGDWKGSLADFLTTVTQADHSTLCYPDWFTHYNTWKSIFGNCQVRFYEESRHNLFGVFCEAAGLANLTQIPDIAPTQQALNIFQLTYLMTLSDSARTGQFSLHKKACMKVDSSRSSSIGFRLLSRQERSQLMEEFSFSNSKLLQALGRQHDDKVFSTPKATEDELTPATLMRSPGFLAYSQQCQALVNTYR